MTRIFGEHLGLGRIVQSCVVPDSLGLVQVCKKYLGNIWGLAESCKVVLCQPSLGFRARVLPEVMSRPSASLSGCLASSFWGAGLPPWGSAWAFFGSETACKYLHICTLLICTFVHCTFAEAHHHGVSLGLFWVRHSLQIFGSPKIFPFLWYSTPSLVCGKGSHLFGS